MSRQDFIQTYKGSSMVDYLDALPYGATDFRTPTEKGWELNTKGFENLMNETRLIELLIGIVVITTLISLFIYIRYWMESIN